MRHKRRDVLVAAPIRSIDEHLNLSRQQTKSVVGLPVDRRCILLRRKLIVADEQALSSGTDTAKVAARLARGKPRGGPPHMIDRVDCDSLLGNQHVL